MAEKQEAQSSQTGFDKNVKLLTPTVHNAAGASIGVSVVSTMHSRVRAVGVTRILNRHPCPDDDGSCARLELPIATF